MRGPGGESAVRVLAQKTLRLTIKLSFLLWTALFAVMLFIEYPKQDAQFQQVMDLKTDLLIQRTQALIKWIGEHGGVYAAIDERELPGKSPSQQPGSDIETPTGRKLTLLNSSAFLRQISTVLEAEGGTRVRLIREPSLDPDLQLDDWEQRALAQLRAGGGKVKTIETRADSVRYRLMAPVREGDMPAALSISLDATEEYRANQKAKREMLIEHLLPWFVGVIGIVLAGRLWKRLLGNLEHSALVDSLTGIYTRREMLGRLKSSVAECARYQQQIVVMMFDIDHFKIINDNYGQLVGDEVLKRVARAIQEELRGGDVLSRYGGEEFLIVCQHTDIEGGRKIAERIRAHIENLKLTTTKGNINLTVSAGVVGYPDFASAETLIEGADSALYQAKYQGRNRVVVQRS
jgi:diguanylate cyclase (GGDEF)-like protein